MIKSNKIKIPFVFLCFILLVNSCVSNKSIRGAMITTKDLETMEIIGFVEVEFEALQSNDNPTLLRKSHDELLKEAKKYHNDAIRIRNIEFRKGNSNKNLIFLLGYGYRVHYITVYAKGAVLRQKNNDKNNDNT